MIIIKGMKMPDGCDSCKLNANGRGCSITGTKYESDTMVLMDFDEYTQRLKDCPLVELQTHGDLISRDAVLNKIEAYVCGSQDSEFIKNEIIKAMPVIIPAEKGETQ